MLEIMLSIGYTRVNKTVSALKELKEYVYWRDLLLCDRFYDSRKPVQ